ncbi:ATP-dependent zinc metalloprotease FtsH [Deinococcus sp. SL84]|uniref:ATP-dependent zinc metalloprotease FtsH n=1 Tax=Deinococcus sp. SL84 TaxID=2994663 RepID=UPI002273D0C9|nr:ATP-dependent zinc metalloprotease FtsH [Deinococcus sp. SL84]MCY1701716.1 ATP-dependent zinc metalloprotease FtsH [Deinococcus sp. SL84]
MHLRPARPVSARRPARWSAALGTLVLTGLLAACGPAATSTQQLQEVTGDGATPSLRTTSDAAASGGATTALPHYTSEQFLRDLRAGKITSAMLSSSGNATVFVRDRPGPEAVALPPDGETLTLLREANVPFTVSSSRSRFAWLGQILPVAVTLLILLVMWRTIRAQQSGAAASAFGKSRASVIVPAKVGVTFADVAGCEEAKADLQEVVDFLRQPEKYRALGARIPHGLLLVGPPGSGKTLLAKAVAGEAGVPYFAVSGSDFVEMFVGVGAARVRDLFEQARKAAPCIIFMDEIDAVGRKRGTGMQGGNDEREQTLNGLLVEMDGFRGEADEGQDIIILAATNRPDVLDAALLRPGRFDRQVVVDAPDAAGRERILRIHSRTKPLDPGVDLSVIARRTAGMVGADLENLLNEAALLAARSGRGRILMSDIDEARDRVLMGPERRSLVIQEADRRITAYHEVGHALAAQLLPHAHRVAKLTVVPRGRAAGYMLPDAKDTLHVTRAALQDMLTVALAGRAAEEVVMGEVTAGAQNDFQQATGLARRMVTEWGMGERTGKVAWASEDSGYLGGGPQPLPMSQATARTIDQEVEDLVTQAHGQAVHLVREYLPQVHRVAEALLQRESLSGEEFSALLAGGQLDGEAGTSAPPAPRPAPT